MSHQTFGTEIYFVAPKSNSQLYININDTHLCEDTEQSNNPKNDQ